jgi:hypothetical protein
LEPDTIGFSDLYIEIDLSLKVVSDNFPKGIRGPLDTVEILAIIERIIKPMNWSMAIDILNSIKFPSTNAYHPLFGVKYKPVYFIIERK